MLRRLLIAARPASHATSMRQAVCSDAPKQLLHRTVGAAVSAAEPSPLPPSHAFRSSFPSPIISSREAVEYPSNPTQSSRPPPPPFPHESSSREGQRERRRRNRRRNAKKQKTKNANEGNNLLLVDINQTMLSTDAVETVINTLLGPNGFQLWNDRLAQMVMVCVHTGQYDGIVRAMFSFLFFFFIIIFLLLLAPCSLLVTTYAQLNHPFPHCD